MCQILYEMSYIKIYSSFIWHRNLTGCPKFFVLVCFSNVAALTKRKVKMFLVASHRKQAVRRRSGMKQGRMKPLLIRKFGEPLKSAADRTWSWNQTLFLGAISDSSRNSEACVFVIAGRGYSSSWLCAEFFLLPQVLPLHMRWKLLSIQEKRGFESLRLLRDLTRRTIWALRPTFKASCLISQRISLST